MSLYFDNERLFDAEGHLTDEGLYALKDGTLDDLGALEAAEHLTFCDWCLQRYTDLLEHAPACLQQPMRDLIPQVQALMLRRSFRIMCNRYVSAVAAVVLAFGMWQVTEHWALQRPAQTAHTPALFAESSDRASLFEGFDKALDGFWELTDLGMQQLKQQSGTAAKGD